VVVSAEKRLEGPFEFLELAHCQSITLRPVEWEFGLATVHPPWLPPERLVDVEVLRIHLSREDKPLFPHHWDLGQKTLIPQVMALLTKGIPEGYAIHIHAVGVAPKKRFEVSLVSV
jgi:hypothetical protein